MVISMQQVHMGELYICAVTVDCSAKQQNHACTIIIISFLELFLEYFNLALYSVQV